MREKVAGEHREMTRGGQSGDFSWRTERCLCCCCVGLWHDDLGEKMKITLPGITTLLQCLLLLLLELERIRSYCFLIQGVFFLHISKSGVFVFFVCFFKDASLWIILNEQLF